MAVISALAAGVPANGIQDQLDRLCHIPVTFVGGTYATGGFATFAQAMEAQLHGLTLFAVMADGLCGGNEPIYDRANDKLLCRVSSSGVEVADAADLTGVTFALILLAY